jgi:hypothetical protein
MVRRTKLDLDFVNFNMLNGWVWILKAKFK